MCSGNSNQQVLPAENNRCCNLAVPEFFFPSDLSFHLDKIESLNEPLHPEEMTGIEQMAPSRLREYIAGRTTARRAMQKLIGISKPVVRNADRSPAWPQELCGSLSHSRKYAVCVLAKRSHYFALGVDVEEDLRLERDLWPLVMTKEEVAYLKTLPNTSTLSTATLIFSAKESYYKTLSWFSSISSGLPEPTQISATLDFKRSTVICSAMESHALPTIQGRFVHLDDHWLTLFSVPYSVHKHATIKLI